MGSTNFHVDYGIYEDWFQGSTIAFVPSTPNELLGVTGSRVTRWGFGVTQAVKSAEADLYAIFNHYALDLSTGNALGEAVATKMDDWMAVTAGMRINF